MKTFPYPVWGTVFLGEAIRVVSIHTLREFKVVKVLIIIEKMYFFLNGFWHLTHMGHGLGSGRLLCGIGVAPVGEFLDHFHLRDVNLEPIKRQFGAWWHSIFTLYMRLYAPS